MNLGEKLKFERNKKGLSLEKLCQELDLFLKTKNEEHIKYTIGKISKWENNKEEPKLYTLKYLAEFYGISLDYLIDNSDTTISANNGSTVSNGNNNETTTTTNNFFGENNDCDVTVDDIFSKVLSNVSKLTKEQLEDLINIINILLKTK